MENFIKELIKEIDDKEEKLNRELIDLVLIEIRDLQDQVEQNFPGWLDKTCV